MKTITSLFVVTLGILFSSIQSKADSITFQITDWSYQGSREPLVNQSFFSATGVNSQGQVIKITFTAGWEPVDVTGITISKNSLDTVYMQVISDLVPGGNFVATVVNGYDPTGTLVVKDNKATGTLSTGTIINQFGSLSFDISLMGNVTGSFLNGRLQFSITGNGGTIVQNSSVTVAAIPEPATIMLLAAGLVIAKIRRRKPLRLGS
jgi:PEP-CTERM motif